MIKLLPRPSLHAKKAMPCLTACVCLLSVPAFAAQLDTSAATRPATERELVIALPATKRPIPEPAQSGQHVPGFKIRGTKGWAWTVDQYLAEIPVLAEYKMNFLMNCYLSLFDSSAPPGLQNRWWEPLPDALKRGLERVVRSCQKHGIEFCFAMHPNLGASRTIDYNSDKDLGSLWQHYDWMLGLGVNWFSICLDDIHTGIDPAGQALLVNAIFQRLRQRNPNAQMIFCPTVYMGTGVDQPQARAYLPVLAERLHPEVYCFWTGYRVVSDVVTRAHAETYKSQIKHRLILWDNYPVNDGQLTLHLGPVIGRDADLCEVVEGYMANPHCSQNEINRVPLLTQADYAYNPAGYDPRRSMGQSILHLAADPVQQTLLTDLVQLFPGMLAESRDATGWNPVLARFEEALNRPNSRYIADLLLAHVEDVFARMQRVFPDRYTAARRTLGQTIAAMRDAYTTRYGAKTR